MSEAQERQEASFDPTGPTSPGQQLRRERERQGLNLEEVAVQLNLRPAVVAGLEEDRYDEVPIAAYRRGYLRAYARLMGIDETRVVDAYNAQYGQGDIDRKVTPVNVTKPPSKVGAWIFRLVTLLVILGLIGLTLLWWQSRNGSDIMEGLGLSDEADVAALDNGEAPAAPDTALPPLPEEDAELGLVEDEADAPTADTTAPETETGMPQADVADEPAVTDAPPAEAPVTADATSPGDIANDTAAAPPAEATEIAGPVEEDAVPAETPVANGRRLEFTFNEESWTEIYDASGQRVLVGLQSPNTQATVEGEPPFRLTVGNASGVELRYRGEPVDLQARAGGTNVARFTLGE